MSVQAVKDNTVLIEQIKFASKLYKFDQQEQQDLSSGYKSVENKTSDQQKSTIVSEKPENQPSFYAYNFRLQSNVPLSKPQRPEKSYNDSKKKQTVEVEDQETGEILDSELVEEEKVNNDLKGKGYYMNAGSSDSGEKRSKSMAELFQEKINHIYNIGFTREPGTLVNLVF